MKNTTSYYYIFIALLFGFCLGVFANYDIANQAQKLKDENPDGALKLIETLCYLGDILGFNFDEKKSIDNDLTQKLMDLIIDIRKIAREEKNWTLSDKIRDDLKSMGITLKDTKDGKTVFEIE